MFKLIARFQDYWIRRVLAISKKDKDKAGNKPVTVITGATEGIGHSLSCAFAGCNHDILLVARTNEALQEHADLLRTTYNVNVYCVSTDLSQTGGCQPVVDALNENELFCDVLVNNAAVGLSGPFISHSPEEINRLANLNVRAATELMRHLLPGMVERDRGGVLNIASLGGLIPGPFQAAYYASKAYLVSLSEALAFEMKDTGIRISVVASGPVATKFHQNMGAENDFYLKFLGTRSAESVARAALFGYSIRQKIIVPGLINTIFSIFVRFVPHFLMVPLVGWLLRRRGNNESNSVSEI